MSKRMTIMVIILVIVFGGIIAFNIFKSIMMKRYFSKFATNAVTVSSVKAVEHDWQPQFHAVGNFVAIKGVNVASQAAGNVVAIHFESGQYVEEGTPLIDIDDFVEQATLKFNQAELALQNINYKRQTDLFKRLATPGSSVDEAKAKLLEAEANVEKTEAMIRQKHIRAPFSGQIGIRQVNLGEFITPGTTSIAPLQSLDPLFMRFYIPEQLATKLKLNQPITFSVEQYPEFIFEGKITAINAIIDANTHTIEVQATIPNCPADALKDPMHSSLISMNKQSGSKKLRIFCNGESNQKNKVTEFGFIPGMFAFVNIEQPIIKNVITLPSTAISYSLYGNSVFVIEPLSQATQDRNGKAVFQVKQVFVITGDQEGNNTIIKDGVKPGQDVVSSGELKLQNGTRVVINNDVKLPAHEDIDSLGQ